MAKQKPKTALEIELERLPNIRSNPRKWTKLQDEMLLKYAPTKGVPALSAILQIPIPTIRDRTRKLRDGGK